MLLMCTQNFTKYYLLCFLSNVLCFVTLIRNKVATFKFSLNNKKKTMHEVNMNQHQKVCWKKQNNLLKHIFQRYSFSVSIVERRQ